MHVTVGGKEVASLKQTQKDYDAYIRKGWQKICQKLRRLSYV